MPKTAKSPRISDLQFIKLAEGPISVSYRRAGALWIATALEFDILGTGSTRALALRQLKELVNMYLTEILGSREKFNLFNPADRSEWDNPDKERFDILVVVHGKQNEKQEHKRWLLKEVRPFRSKVHEFNLSPAYL